MIKIAYLTLSLRNYCQIYMNNGVALNSIELFDFHTCFKIFMDPRLIEDICGRSITFNEI
jgi:hypothetical protein